MGVPSFYRWLVNKYPNIVVPAVEEKGGKSIDPNPNGVEFDNLYLDMNGIIHPCFHPDDNPFPPATFEEVFNNIFEYIDRLFNLVRPRKLLYLAIDGVAPRAKMNQQRARRFRTAKDNEIAEKEEERLRRQFQMEGKDVLPKSESEVSDSNVITPGTEFMYRLSKELKSYICLRINNDPGWKEIQVILSDANVPGEGEHKIISFIRLQRTVPEYNPNTRHCLYGLDADLIMLALATHEVHFSILREDVLVQESKLSCESSLESSLNEADLETSLAKSRGWFKQIKQEQKPSSELAAEISHDEAESASAISEKIHAVNRTSVVKKKPYQFLHVWILREYLELDMEITNAPEKFEADSEQIIDDFIFICLFVGNDFLPHMPTLEIHEGAIDLLMHVYKTEFKNLGGHLVDMKRVEDKKGGYIKLKRVEKFILLVGTYEEKIFKKRSELRIRKLRRILSDYEDARDEEADDTGPTSEMNSVTIEHAVQNVKAPTSIESRAISDEKHTSLRVAANNSEILKNTKDLKEKLKDYIRKTQDVFKDALGEDKVKLGAVGWKERYYKQKFSADSLEEIESIRKAVVEKYTEGLCWVLLYYFSGVPSWTWFYPFHYGPFASDMKGLGQTRVKFQKGLPFKPFDQLLGVLPPRSAHALPLPYQPLMTDEHSEIIDFYPSDFDVDIDGKRYMWQGICKLSFIDEERLLAETRKLEKELKDEEIMRNGKNVDKLLLDRNQNLSEGMNGFVSLKLDDSNAVNFDGPEEDIQETNVKLYLLYEPQTFCQHIPRLLEGVNVPDKIISKADIEERQLWHELLGSRPNNRYRIQSQERPRKESYCSNFSSANMSSTVIIKGGGSGWGGGRGKVCTSTPQRVHSREGFVQVEPTRGIEGLSISESKLGIKSCGRAHSMKNNFCPTRSYGGAQPGNNNVWITGNGSASLNSSHEWRPRVQQTTVHSNQYYGRPQLVVSNNAWTTRNSSVASAYSNSCHGCRPIVQQSTAHGNQYYGRPQPVVSNNAWTTRNSSVSSAYSNSSHGWRPRAQSTAVQGHQYFGGRGQFVNPSTESWNGRNYGTSSWDERDGWSW